MGRLYDISKKIDRSKSTVKIDDEHIYTINASIPAGIKIKAISKDENIDEFEKINQVIQVGLGKKAFEYINSLDLEIPDYTPIVNSIIAAVNGVSIEELEKAAEEEKNKKK